MREDVTGAVLDILLIITIIGFIVIGIWDDNTHYYECTDVNGNTIYCERVDNTRGDLTGLTNDGKTIIITSYKRVLKEGE